MAFSAGLSFDMYVRTFETINGLTNVQMVLSCLSPIALEGLISLLLQNQIAWEAKRQVGPTSIQIKWNLDRWGICSWRDDCWQGKCSLCSKEVWLHFYFPLAKPVCSGDFLYLFQYYQLPCIGHWKKTRTLVPRTASCDGKLMAGIKIIPPHLSFYSKFCAEENI